MPSSLYLHVPFCPQICPYCDFHKMRRHEGLAAAYLERLEAEVQESAAKHRGSLRTIYLGGGTPSALTDRELARLTAALDSAWGFPAQQETTIEADPLTFDRQRLATFRDLGFSRLSIGVQSTQDDVLRLLGRRHDARAGLQALEWALGAGFEVTADLITAVPGQDTERDLRRLAGTGVPHLSVYTLTVEPHTPFARKGLVVDEERAADDFELAAAVLGEHGLQRYEVSSHALPGHESQHNQAYWHGEHFLGLGPAAAAFLPAPDSPGMRVTNPPIKGWLRGEAPTAEKVTADEYVLERLMTGLRTRRGVDLADVRQRSGIDPLARYAKEIAELRRHGMLLPANDGRLRVTDDGLIRLDAVLRTFFAAAAA